MPDIDPPSRAAAAPETVPASGPQAMAEPLPGTVPGSGSAGAPAASASAWPVWQWLFQGCRAALLLRVDAQRPRATRWQALGVLLLVALAQLGLDRLAIPGSASLQWANWLASFAVSAAVIGISAFAFARSPAPLLNWLLLWWSAGLPLSAAQTLLARLGALELLPAGLRTDGGGELLSALLWLWLAAITWRLTAGWLSTRLSRAALVLALTGANLLMAWQLPGSDWADDSAVADDLPEMTLSQAVFERQQDLMDQALAAVQPARPGRINVYSLVFAPYAQDVFLREGRLVDSVLRERFGAQDHSVLLVNHPDTAETLPWATPENLLQSLDTLSQAMDRERDVLVLYLASHGGDDFQLAAQNPPLSVDPLTPLDLRRALDQAGLRNVVIVISACFSGGWVTPLATPTTLVMTAADATHTSFGCGSRSELTFFGRALFDEELRHSYSLEDAFHAAVPRIQKREVEAGKDDGFSNPQISVGAQLRPVLAALARQLQNQNP